MAHKSHFNMSKDFEKVPQFDESYLLDHLGDYLEEPFKEIGLALFYWSPIADALKDLDKKIVLNSIKLKWNLVVEEFKKLTTNLKFN